MPAFRSFFRHVSAVAFLFLSAASLRAQVTTISDTTSTPTPGVGHDYIHLLSETVNPANGSVSVRIAVPMPKGRGISIPFAFGYDSNGISHPEPGNPGRAFWTSNIDSFAQGGWSYVYPSLRADSFNFNVAVLTGNNNGQPIYTIYPCTSTTNYLFMDGTGGIHSLGLGSQDESNPPPGGCPGAPPPSGTGGDPEVSASLVPVAGGNFQVLPVTVYDKSGTIYYFSTLPGGPFPNNTTTSGAPSYIEDRNGNKITGTQSGNTGLSFTDTLGRTVLSINGFGPSGSTNTVTAGGLSYQITWKTVTTSYTLPATNIQNLGGSCVWSGGPSSNSYVVVSKITLTNNQFYQFYYGDNPNPSFQNPYGLLSEIDYPDGGSVKYTWKLSDTLNELADYPGGEANGQGGLNPVTDGCLYQYKTPVIASREVFYGGSSPALTQSFTYGTVWSSRAPATWTTKTTAQSSTDNITGLTTQTNYCYTPTYIPVQPFANTNYPAQVPLESVTAYGATGQPSCSVSSSALRTTVKTWYDPFDLASQQTYLENGTTSSNIVYCYAGKKCVPPPTLSQLIEKDEYDFGASSATRKTLYTYQGFSNTPGVIADRPCKVLTQNGSGTTFAETDYFYDGATSCSTITAATVQASSVSGLETSTRDETTFGSSSSTPRGNVTKVTHKCLQGCSTDSSTTYSFDETGQVTQSQDALGNISKFDYGNNFDSNPSYDTNAYLHTVTDALQHVTTFQYAFSDGQLLAATDQNNRTTYYDYNDSLRRLTETDYPDGGKTTITYNDASYNPSTPSPSITTTEVMTSTTNLTTLTAFDGLGHTLRSALTSDPDCSTGDRTDTTYDGFARVHTASNAYCTTGDQTYGLTTYAYDALGRTTQVTHPDNNTVLTSYSGRATQVQDEGNGTQRVTRVSQTDALGRLTSVCEVSSATLMGQNGAPASCGQDIAATGFLTSYQFDVLDNLLQVNQGTMAARMFSYDSLSRLISASNPESGTISYSYDANGNLTSKKDARSITTTYSYDTLNRNTQKSYSDGTPTATFVYDISTGAYGITIYNPVGRLVEASASSALTMNNYDSMGRIIAQYEQIPTSYPYFGLWYDYDLMGNITAYTNGEFANFTNFYNTAGRLTSLTSSVSDSQHPPNLLSGAHYNALGAITSDTLGDGETESWVYNDKRGRLTSYTATLSATSIYSLTIPTSGGYAPNSDILVANDSANGSWTYSYDQFNRLAGSNKNSGSAVYSYVYDRFGNRLQQNGPNTFLATFTGNNPSNPQNNNRLDGYSYDASGNMLSDGTHTYSYDAENRITKVDNGATATYVYDALGRRVEKTTTTNYWNECSYPNGGTVFYVYDLSDHAEVYTQNGVNQCKDDIFAAGRMVAEYEGDTVFYHADWLGTARARRFYTGQVTQNCSSLPFGDALSCNQNLDPGVLHFTGKQRDYETNLDNFGARYDSSAMGRFISPDYSDPSDSGNPQGLNLYSYVQNNPSNATDPDGHDCVFASGNYAYVARGDCTGIKNGVYVPGTVDLKSGYYDREKHTLSVSYTPYDGPGLGKVVIGNHYPRDTSPTEFEKFAHTVGGGADVVDSFVANVGVQAAADGVGRAIGLGVEAIQAARAARAAEAAVDLDNLTSKVVRRMLQGGWTKQDILDAIKNGKAYGAINNATGGPATEYVTSSGRFVVIDDTTKQVIQVSRPGQLPNYLVK